MKFKELCEKRFSVRAYLPEEIEQEKINYILECARMSPSAANKQPWIFYIVRDESVRKQLHSCYHRPWFADAPLYIIVCKDTSQSWKRTNSDGKDHGDIDAAIAAEHICMAAHEQGLGTCWICNFDPILLREVLKIEEEHIEPVVIFPVAYINQENNKEPIKTRKDLSETTRWI